MLANLEKITPTMAKKYLANNIENNRPVKRRWVNTLVTLMSSDDWMQNGDSIKFQKANGDGVEKLIDGQHRLHAIIRLGKPVEFLVIRGLSAETFLTIDAGKKRSTADCLAIAGHKQTTILAAALRNLQMFKVDHTLATRRSAYPTTQLFQLLADQPELEESVLIGHKGRFIVPGSILVFLHYLTSRDNPEKAYEFITKITEGVSMVKGDPVLTFRDRMFRYKAANVKVRRDFYIGLLFKTWNYWLSGEACNKLRFGYDEDFPILLGYDRAKMFGSDYPVPEIEEDKKNSKQGKLFS